MLTWLQKEFVERFDPDSAYLKQAIRTAISSSVAILIYHITPNYTQSYWLILAAAFLIQTRLGYTQKDHINFILIASLMAAICSSLVVFFISSTLLLATYLAITTFLAVFVNVINLNIAITGFFINLFVIMSAGLPCEPYEWFQRGLMILCGGLIAVLTSLLWPSRVSESWNLALQVYYFSLAELVSVLSKSLLQKNSKQRLGYEDLLHERRNRCLRNLYTLRHLSRERSQTNDLLNAEHLYTTLISIGNLRHRLSLEDNTLRMHINNILLEIKAQLFAKANGNITASEKLPKSINELEKQIDNIPLAERAAIDAFLVSCLIFYKEIKLDAVNNTYA